MNIFLFVLFECIWPKYNSTIHLRALINRCQALQQLCWTLLCFSQTRSRSSEISDHQSIHWPQPVLLNLLIVYWFVNAIGYDHLTIFTQKWIIFFFKDKNIDATRVVQWLKVVASPCIGQLAVTLLYDLSLGIHFTICLKNSTETARVVDFKCKTNEQINKKM